MSPVDAKVTMPLQSGLPPLLEPLEPPEPLGTHSLFMHSSPGQQLFVQPNAPSLKQPVEPLELPEPLDPPELLEALPQTSLSWHTNGEQHPPEAPGGLQPSPAPAQVSLV